MSPKLFPFKILFYLFVSVLIFATTQLVAVDESQNDHKIKPLLAKVYRQKDVSQWMVSEKLDRVRGIWNDEKLHFCSGKLIHAPKWFTENFPAQSMDGELWIGRGTFDRISGIVRKKIPDERDWKQVRYMLFEIPESSGNFTERIQKMVKLTTSVKIPWLQAIPQIHIDSEGALLKMLDEIVKKVGEGLMLHLPDSLYHSVRSDDLLKFKPWQECRNDSD